MNSKKGRKFYFCHKIPVESYSDVCVSEVNRILTYHKGSHQQWSRRIPINLIKL